MEVYKRTQPGTVIIVVMLIAIALILATKVSSDLSAYIVASALGLVAALFSCLTIKVKDDELVWYFGPYFWKKSVKVQDIESVTATRTSWLNGWGIRYTSKGWLYNVSGTEAVEIELKDGKVFLLGTDDSRGLVEALSKEN